MSSALIHQNGEIDKETARFLQGNMSHYIGGYRRACTPVQPSGIWLEYMMEVLGDENMTIVTQYWTDMCNCDTS